MEFLRRGIVDFDSQIIRMLLVDLYVKYFKFLTEALVFFCSKTERMKASFSKSFYDKNVEGLVKDVLKVIQRIRDETGLITQRRVHDINKKMDLMMAEMESRSEDNEQAQKKRDELADRLLLGLKCAETLRASEQQSLYQIEGKLASIPLRTTDIVFQGFTHTDCIFR